MSKFENITTDIDGPIFIVTINRPHKMNAVDPETNFEMAAAFDQFRDDADLFVAILTGQGDKAFCRPRRWLSAMD